MDKSQALLGEELGGGWDRNPAWESGASRKPLCRTGLSFGTKGDINFLVVVNYLTIGNLKKDGFILTCSLRVECPQKAEGEARWQEGQAATSSAESREQ